MVPQKGDKRQAEEWVSGHVRSARETTTFREIYAAYEKWSWEATLSPPVHVRALANILDASGFRRGGRSDTGKGTARRMSRKWFIKLTSN